MFFQNSKDKKEIINALEQIELLVKNKINKAPTIENNCSNSNKDIMNKVISILNMIDAKRVEDLKVFGEIMLGVEQLSDGFTNTKIIQKTSDPRLAYIIKIMNGMSQKFDSILIEIDEILEKYKAQDYSSSIDENVFRGGRFKNLTNSINNVKNEMQQGILQSYQIGNKMKSESSKLLDNSSKLSQSAQRQVSALGEIKSSVNEATTAIANNTNTAVEMSQYGSNVKKSIDDGMQLASKTVSAMEGINHSTEEIHVAIDMIDQIAFQTNILSLNAAVEAATAGEAGKGFAVVAQEVRNLANKSAEAAKAIKDLVEVATSKANEGKNIADAMIQGYKILNEDIAKTTSLIEKVVIASQEQKENMSVINNTVGNIEALTAENASTAKNIGESSISMVEIADENLNKIKCEQFKDMLNN